MVTLLSDLGPGTYYIGGYQKGRLYLATGGLTSVNHCLTSEFTFDNGRLEALGAAPVAVKIESAGEENGYYVRFDGDGYLSATGSGAGKLRFTQSRAEYWIFSESVGGGFDMLGTSWYVLSYPKRPRRLCCAPLPPTSRAMPSY